MRPIDLAHWNRREHFEFYSVSDHPHFGTCADVDLTPFHEAITSHGYPVNVAIVYVLSRASSAIPEFRYRIRGGQVVEHDVVHPSITIQGKRDVFGFCTLDHAEGFGDFCAKAVEVIAATRQDPTLEEDRSRDDLLFVAAIPWVSFTSFMHPIHLQPPDSVPRFAWGKFFQEGQCLRMPPGVQANHAVMDGVHMGRLYALVQDYFQHPEMILGEG
jgi:chloramphenicol O-acetyltransferase type A